MSPERDPAGIPPHAPGAKLDGEKVMAELTLDGFSRALLAVAEVSTYGARKYSPGGWQLLGRTPLRLFDPKANPVTLIQAGEWVRFIPVSEEEYLSVENQVQQGTYTVHRTKEAHA